MDKKKILILTGSILVIALTIILIGFFANSTDEIIIEDESLEYQMSVSEDETETVLILQKNERSDCDWKVDGADGLP